MFSALKERLQTLADNHRGFRDEVRKLADLSPEEATYVANDLRRMVLALPDMLAQIRAWSEDPGLPWDFRRLYGYALIYVGNTEDFFPERDKGLIGYLDDAYLAGSILERAIHEANVRPHWNNALLAERIPGWLSTTQWLLPQVTSRIDRIVLEWRDGDWRHLLDHPAAQRIA